jgi:hypothetical protein
MKRFPAILLVSAAAVAVTLTASGSSYAADTPAQAPAQVTSQDTAVFQNDDDTTGCRSHRMHLDDAPADSIKG